MTANVHSSGAGKIDVHHPPDTPFALGNVSPVVPHTLPPDVEREVEDALRIASRHALQMESYQKAISDSRMAIATQSVWFLCGAFIARRGYRFADPLQSFLKPYTENVFINKATNASTLMGGVMAGVTLFQMPTDVMFHLAAKAAYVDEEQKKNAVLMARNATLAQYHIDDLAKGVTKVGQSQ